MLFEGKRLCRFVQKQELSRHLPLLLDLLSLADSLSCAAELLKLLAIRSVTAPGEESIPVQIYSRGQQTSELTNQLVMPHRDMQ